MLSTGPATFTEQDLRDACSLANDDPTYRTPRLKLGHVAGGWQASDGTDSGEPAFGQFSNLRVGNYGQELFADIINVPDWLAGILPSAYPSRSIEGQQGYKSNAGKTYGLAIDAVALLGVEMPGVASLDDLQAILTNPEVTVTEEGNFQIAAARGVRAQVDVDFVRRQAYEQVATGDRYWWWIRSVRIDPNELIMEDEESGELYRVPFTADGNDVTFAEAIKVYEQFTDAPSEEQEPIAASSWKTAAQSRPSTRGGRMTPKELRAAIGLPESASDEEVKERLKTLKADDGTEAPPPPAPDPDEESEDEDEGDDGDTETETPPAEPAAPSTTTVDAAAFRQLQEDARLGREAREQQITARRKGRVKAAIAAGKIPPSRREHYEKLMSADEEGTAALLDELQAGVIPVELVGQATVDAGVSGHDDSYPVSWLSPDERARVNAARKQEVVS
jgi:hypothetical protein